MCAFGLRDPRFRAFRAQNRGFCALLPSETPIFGHFEHKKGFFVSEWVIFHRFWGFSSTKLGFLCSFTKLDVGVGALSRRKRHRCTCAAYTTADATAASLAEPLHLRSRRICAAAVPSAVACSRLPPVPPVLPLLPPLHLRGRCAICLCSLSHLRSRYYLSLPPSHLPARAG